MHSDNNLTSSHGQKLVKFPCAFEPLSVDYSVRFNLTRLCAICCCHRWWRFGLSSGLFVRVCVWNVDVLWLSVHADRIAFFGFYRATICAIYALCPSVCMSVCLAVTSREFYQIHHVQNTISPWKWVQLFEKLVTCLSSNIIKIG